VAALHLDNFNRVSKEMDVNWFKGDVEQKEVVHLKRSARSAGLDIDTTHRLKRTRQQADDEMV
jgi:hypothetical protein